jgi:alanine-glyoxylate transaminase / serine-glyoxylate transaminase / serine-pyruvate transaminase
MDKKYQDLQVSSRLLLGPGPSNVHPRVLKAMATPLIGHLDPEFLGIMNETMELLRWLFRTENRLTLPMSGTGSLGMETCFVNILEAGDPVLICVNGVFGQRMVDNAERCGARVDTVTAPWGESIDPGQVEKALAEKPCKLLAVVHAETSTGVLQPLEDLGRLAKAAGALFLVDSVTSLGGCPLEVDATGIDLCYSGTQKCLSVPPSLSPVTFNDRALSVMERRRSKVQSWYQDLSMIASYWGQERVYHHTAPVSAIFALREGLRIIHEEGLPARIQRHRKNAAALWAGLEGLGLKLLVTEKFRAPSLTTVRIPEGIDDAAVRRALLSRHNIEVGGGLGTLKGKVWRIGLMGENSHMNNVLLLLAVLGGILEEMGYACSVQEALAEASRAAS